MFQTGTGARSFADSALGAGAEATDGATGGAADGVSGGAATGAAAPCCPQPLSSAAATRSAAAVLTQPASHGTRRDEDIPAGHDTLTVCATPRTGHP